MPSQIDPFAMQYTSAEYKELETIVVEDNHKYEHSHYISKTSFVNQEQETCKFSPFIILRAQMFTYMLFIRQRVTL